MLARVTAQATRGSITYAGHATVLIQLGEKRLLTDPLLRDRLLGVLRRHRGLGREALGRIDGVLISHLHPDHLDFASLRGLGDSIPIVAPRGAAALLARRGFPNVTELSAGEETELAGVGIRATDAKHTGGRLFGMGHAGVVGYLIDAGARVYFAGDTELFGAMTDLGE